MGVRTLGECLRLPRDGFARRFGAAPLTMLDRARGGLPEPRASFAAREKFATRRDLEPEITDTARLGHAIEPLLEELCRFLRANARNNCVIAKRR
jgi:protein ImuB